MVAPDEIELNFFTTGMAIREFLSKVGEGSPNDFFRAFKKNKPTTSYGSIRRYFFILKKLGLIEPTRKVQGRGRFPKQLYRIVPGMIDDPRWRAPQAAYYPETKLGGKRYIKKEDRLKKKRKI